jgi:hypothetical protein
VTGHVEAGIARQLRKPAAFRRRQSQIIEVRRVGGTTRSGLRRYHQSQRNL